MSRHLDLAFVSSALRRGKAVACFLGAGPDHADEPTIRWLVIRARDGEFGVSLYEAIDPRDPSFLDIGEFQSTVPEPASDIRWWCSWEHVALIRRRGLVRLQGSVLATGETGSHLSYKQEFRVRLPGCLPMNVIPGTWV